MINCTSCGIVSASIGNRKGLDAPPQSKITDPLLRLKATTSLTSAIITLPHFTKP